MDLVPNHRALLGVDVVSSASNHGYHLNAIPDAVNGMVDDALRGAGINLADVVFREKLVDGALLTLPSDVLGVLLEVAARLDAAASMRNRVCKPDIRLRIAIEVGPVGPEPGFYQSKIFLGRLLEAAAFTKLFERCLAEQPELVNTGLLLSGEVRKVVFGGNHTSRRLQEFVELPVEHKEFAGTAWYMCQGSTPEAWHGWLALGRTSRPTPRRGRRCTTR